MPCPFLNEQLINVIHVATNDFKIGIHSFPARRSALKGTVWKTSWQVGKCGKQVGKQVGLLCRWERH